MQTNIILNNYLEREVAFSQRYADTKDAIKLPIINHSRGSEITKQKLLEEIDNRSIIGMRACVRACEEAVRIEYFSRWGGGRRNGDAKKMIIQISGVP